MDIIVLLYRRLRRRLKKTMLYLHRRNLLKYVKGGEGLHLEGKIMVIYGDKLTLGQDIHIGRDTFIDCKGGVTIGDNTILSRHVTIYSHDHNFKKPSCLPYDYGSILKSVHIGRYVWIGQNVTIAPGTKIGDGAVLGLGSVVSGEIPENAIVVNQKVRIVGYRDEEHTLKLRDKGQFYKHPL